MLLLHRMLLALAVKFWREDSGDFRADCWEGEFGRMGWVRRGVEVRGFEGL